MQPEECNQHNRKGYQRFPIARICDPAHNPECLNFHLGLHAELLKHPSAFISWNQERDISTRFDGERLRVKHKKRDARNAEASTSAPKSKEKANNNASKTDPKGKSKAAQPQDEAEAEAEGEAEDSG